MAATTTTYTDKVTHAKPLSVPVTTYRAGDLTAVATYASNGLRNELAIYTGDGATRLCLDNNATGTLTCTATAVPAGSYLVVFKNYNAGRIDVTLTVTGETAP